jgi:hypothetical protein
MTGACGPYNLGGSATLDVLMISELILQLMSTDVIIFIEANDTDSNKNYHDRRLDAPMITRANFTHHGFRRNYLHK